MNNVIELNARRATREALKADKRENEAAIANLIKAITVSVDAYVVIAGSEAAAEFLRQQWGRVVDTGTRGA